MVQSNCNKINYIFSQYMHGYNKLYYVIRSQVYQCTCQGLTIGTFANLFSVSGPLLSINILGERLFLTGLFQL